MDIRSILNAGGGIDSAAAAARANTLPAQLHSTPQSSPQSSTRPLPPQMHPARQSSLPAFSNASASPPRPPYTPRPPPVATPYQREHSISVSPKTKITSLSIPPSVHLDPEPVQNPTPVSSLDQPVDAPHRLATGAPAGLPPESMPSSEPVPAAAAAASSSIIASSPQQAPSRKRSISTVEPEDTHRKRVRHELPRWARRADWDNLQADVERIVEEVLRARAARAARARPSSSHGKPASVAVDRSPVVPVSAPPNGHAQHHLRDPPLRRPEPTITNFEPYSEFDRKIADFLFQTVVMGPDLGHPAVGGPNAVFEIEAKIGTLINRDDGVRMALPVRSEAILVPGLATRFESTMTKIQHREMNRFLNRETQLSQQPPRVPIHYRHSVEVDSFHPLSSAAVEKLPMYARDLLAMRKHSQKIRVTRDTKTNQVTAKIVKARIADLDIYCPDQVFDVRISVNVEMRYDGAIDALVDGSEANGSQPPRRKDRLSYEHQGVRIDLTQVGDPREGATTCSHELEVEVDAEEVRRQGLLAHDGQENSFEPLVKRFLDNVRVLLRAGTPPATMK